MRVFGKLMPRHYVSVITFLLLGNLVGIGIAQYPEHGAQTWWAPDSGRYWVTRQYPGYAYGWAYSWDIVWDADANRFTASHAYQHEFRTPTTGYARWYQNAWLSSLPCPSPYIDEPEDEFSISCREPYNIVPGTKYMTVVYLAPQDPAVTTAKFDLEAELQLVLLRVPCTLHITYAVEGYDILARFTAPATGSWGSGASSETSRPDEKVKVMDIEEYAKEAHRLLEKLADESPGAITKALVRFSSLMTSKEADDILSKYNLKTIHVQGILPNLTPANYFRVETTDGSVVNAVRLIDGLILRHFEAVRKEYETSGGAETWRSALESLQPVVNAIKNGEERVVSVIVEGKPGLLKELTKDSNVKLVDVKYSEYSKVN